MVCALQLALCLQGSAMAALGETGKEVVMSPGAAQSLLERSQGPPPPHKLGQPPSFCSGLSLKLGQ